MNQDRRGIALTKQFIEIGEPSERALAVALSAFGVESVSLTPNLVRAPKIELDGNRYRLPDLLSWSETDIWYSESKGYHAPSWRIYPPGPRWEHLMPLNEFNDFMEIQKRTGLQVRVFVLERFDEFTKTEERERWIREGRSLTPVILWATLDEIARSKRIGQDPETKEHHSAVYFPRSILRELCEWNPADFLPAENKEETL